MVAYNVLIFVIYPTIADQGEFYKDMINKMPALKAMLGMTEANFSDILNYYGTYSSVYYLLAGSIYAMILGAGILSKEENDKTIEFLLSKPITRSSIVTSKVLCTFLYLFLFNLVYSISSVILVNIYSENSYSSTAFILFLVSPLMVFFIFAALGLILSVFIVKTKSILPLAIGTAMGCFLVGGVSAITEKADWLKYLSPFKYVDSSGILEK
jgi:ABC-2 type transporter.